MNLRIKKQFSTLLLALTVLGTTSSIIQASENEKRNHLTISPKMWGISLVFLIPLWQCMKKSPKAVIPTEEEYSWKEIKESLEILLCHYSNKLTRWLQSKQTKYSDKEIKNATKKLWHNIKNLYNMGIVGQKKYQSLLKLKGNFIECTQSTPARGICGHLLNMMGECDKLITTFVSLAAGYILFKHTLTYGYTINVTNASNMKAIGR